MHTEPDLNPTLLRDFLRRTYGIDAARIDYRAPGGECAWLYDIRAADATRYLLKVTQPGLCGGIASEQGQRAAWALRHQCGIAGVTAALRGQTGLFVYPLAGYLALLLPFVDGDVPGHAGLTEAQQIALGRLLARIHTAEVPPQDQPPHDDFGAALLDQLARVLTVDLPDPSPAQRHMLDLLRRYHGGIVRLAAQFEAQRQQVTALPVDWVICHSDPHAWNVILRPGGDLVLIDWDTPLLAPREHDLWFQQEQAALLAGYAEIAGPVILQPAWIDFYRRRWAVAEVVDYGWRTLRTRQSEAQYEHDVAALTQHLHDSGLREDTP